MGGKVIDRAEISCAGVSIRSHVTLHEVALHEIGEGKAAKPTSADIRRDPP